MPVPDAACRGGWRKFLRRRSVAGSLVVLLMVPLAQSCGERGAKESAGRDETYDTGTLVADLFAIYESLGPGQSPMDAEAERLLSESLGAPDSDPNWPTLTFIAAEIELRQGNTGNAGRSFRNLAKWGSSTEPDPQESGSWGGSGLAVLGLWRWLEILEDQDAAPADRVSEAIEVALKLRSTRFYRGMLESGLLPGLPQLEEDLARTLAHLAWKTGHPKRRTLFLEALGTYATHRVPPEDQVIIDELIGEGLLDSRHLQLFRAKRMLALVLTRPEQDIAIELLRSIWDDTGLGRNIRSEAGYLWCHYMRRRGNPQEIIRILSEVIELSNDDEIAEMALYRRAMTQNTQPLFEKDMELLISDYPDGFFSDDALYQLATRSLYSGDLEDAIERYRQLQELPRPHDYEDSAYILPAIGLIGRYDTADPDVDALQQAESFLERYVETYPNGVFRLRGLFWQGRISEATGETATARERFGQVLREAPHSYFGIRAQLHLEHGRDAERMVLPDPGSGTALRIRDSYNPDLVPTQLMSGSAYHRRLQAAAASGLYRRVLERAKGIERSLRRRLDGIPLEDLESRGLIAPVGLLLALREDLYAARDSETEAENWLQLAGLAGQEFGDWPLAIEATSVVGERLPWRRRMTLELQSDPSFLGTVYPTLAESRSPELDQALIDYAWDVDGSTALSRSLMYAVIRNESRFYAGAISPVGAVGLFQFMPHVFRSLKSSLNLSEEVGAQSDFDFLSVPRNNVSVWSRWVAAERFGFDTRDGLAAGLMKHHAGSGNLRRWSRTWRMIRPESEEADLEFRIDTPGFNATRVFVQAVIRDTAIAEAAGMFRD
ncbi:MAG: tetratricopeptide repeat protein [Bryobacterales bacterium]|nr:tetratricopeptide repeat protein [Bryobacterales bacterium]